MSLENGEEAGSVVKGEEETGTLVKFEETGSLVSRILNGIVLCSLLNASNFKYLACIFYFDEEFVCRRQQTLQTSCEAVGVFMFSLILAFRMLVKKR